LTATRPNERHPAGAQAALTAPGENVIAVKDLLTDLLRLPDPLRRVAEIMEGAAQDWAPDMRATEQINHSIAAAMKSGRALLIDGSDAHLFTTIAEPWGGRVELIDVNDSPIDILIRPDGYLAWEAKNTTQESTNTLTEALIRWFGPAHPPTR
jgi:hypothetical protein